MKRVLFVCLGNICRSPAAEAVTNSIIVQRDLADLITCDSAGVSAYHAGEPADARMRRHGEKRGYFLSSISRQFEPQTDFDQFDFIVAMDQSNISDLKRLSSSTEHHDKLSMMCDFAVSRSEKEVPDPYYGGADGFEHVFDILEDACLGLINQIEKNLR